MAFMLDGPFDLILYDKKLSSYRHSKHHARKGERDDQRCRPYLGHIL